ncbi:EutP/PduV family microcompartment system protein [Loigolactobacillus zhaoyuanensis]|uniref:EutP/PduV family microcompartment system protein n=1 Tax=Loigolactobacillus zhaoyuanensis TaxID=2486017 RepID=A0ABW8UBP4_9LACO|nr:EutP/PduV family microcompartment system protein [Loigolactobacillus zhaoyuanensis]
MKQKIMIIGARNSGKTALVHFLDQQDPTTKMSACMVYGKRTLNVPGAYLECPWMHQHIIAAQQDAKCILMLSSIDHNRRFYPPNFAKVFRLPVFGILTTRDSIPLDAPIVDVLREFDLAGVSRPFYKVNLDKPSDLDLIETIVS